MAEMLERSRHAGQISRLVVDYRNHCMFALPEAAQPGQHLSLSAAPTRQRFPRYSMAVSEAAPG
jgi:hypothetical protein